MCFNPKKTARLSVNAKVMTKCEIADTEILTNSIYKVLSIIISSDLSWDHAALHKNIIPKTYRMFGLLCHMQL